MNKPVLFAVLFLLVLVGIAHAQDTCTLKSVKITPLCGTDNLCDAGEKIKVEAVYSSTCPSSTFLQIDMDSFSLVFNIPISIRSYVSFYQYDGICSIAKDNVGEKSGFISGINGPCNDGENVVTAGEEKKCIFESISFSNIPSFCNGRNMTISGVGLYSGSSMTSDPLSSIPAPPIFGLPSENKFKFSGIPVDPVLGSGNIKVYSIDVSTREAKGISLKPTSLCFLSGQQLDDLEEDGERAECELTKSTTDSDKIIWKLTSKRPKSEDAENKCHAKCIEWTGNYFQEPDFNNQYKISASNNIKNEPITSSENTYCFLTYTAFENVDDKSEYPTCTLYVEEDGMWHFSASSEDDSDVACRAVCMKYNKDKINFISTWASYYSKSDSGGDGTCFVKSEPDIRCHDNNLNNADVKGSQSVCYLNKIGFNQVGYEAGLFGGSSKHEAYCKTDFDEINLAWKTRIGTQDKSDVRCDVQCLQWALKEKINETDPCANGVPDENEDGTDCGGVCPKPCTPKGSTVDQCIKDNNQVETIQDQKCAPKDSVEFPGMMCRYKDESATSRPSGSYLVPNCGDSEHPAAFTPACTCPGTVVTGYSGTNTIYSVAPVTCDKGPIKYNNEYLQKTSFYDAFSTGFENDELEIEEKVDLLNQQPRDYDGSSRGGRVMLDGDFAYQIEKQEDIGYSIVNFPLKTRAGKTYTAEVYAKTDPDFSSPDFARMYISKNGISEGEKIASTIFHKGDGKWQKLSIDFIADAGNYYAVLEAKDKGILAYFDDLSVTEHDFGCFESCYISSSQISSSCDGKCDKGENVKMSVVFGGNCPNKMFLQVDAKSDDDECNVENNNGDIEGFSIICDDSNIAFESDGIKKKCTGEWTVTQIPENCADKTVTATMSALWRTDATNEQAERITRKSPTGNQFITFGDATGPPACPNGTIERGEECDTLNFNGKACEDFNNTAGKPFTSGHLACTDACKINTDQCTVDPPVCGDNICDKRNGESNTICPQDCLNIDFTEVKAYKVEENYLRFQGTASTQAFFNFRACSDSSSIDQCLAATECGIGKPCICSHRNRQGSIEWCDAVCGENDKGNFYLIGDISYGGTEIQIISPSATYSCKEGTQTVVPKDDLDIMKETFVRYYEQASKNIDTINRNIQVNANPGAEYWRNLFTKWNDIRELAQAGVGKVDYARLYPNEKETALQEARNILGEINSILTGIQ